LADAAVAALCSGGGRSRHRVGVRAGRREPDHRSHIIAVANARYADYVPQKIVRTIESQSVMSAAAKSKMKFMFLSSVAFVQLHV
jgi:hypothetical protein